MGKRVYKLSLAVKSSSEMPFLNTASADWRHRWFVFVWPMRRFYFSQFYYFFVLITLQNFVCEYFVIRKIYCLLQYAYFNTGVCVIYELFCWLKQRFQLKKYNTKPVLNVEPNYAYSQKADSTNLFLVYQPLSLHDL